MNDEQLQFAISQYIDGTLPGQEKAELEQRLATDPRARELLAEYRRLETLVAGGVPAVDMDWSALASKISDAVAEEADAIPPTLSMPWVWKVSALAASVLICIGLLVIYGSSRQPAQTHEVVAGKTPAPLPVPAQKAQELAIAVLTTESVAGAPSTTVTIGPAGLTQLENESNEASITIAASPWLPQDDSNNVLQ
jgi:anti-sigma factor RsiW